MQGYSQQVCEGFLAKWENLNRKNFGEAENWEDWLTQDERGLEAALEPNRGINTTGSIPTTPEQVQTIFANLDAMNAEFAQSQGQTYTPVNITPDEAKLVLNIYHRRSYPNFYKMPVSCELIQNLVAVPMEQIRALEAAKPKKQPAEQFSLAEEPEGADSDDEDLNLANMGTAAPAPVLPFSGGPFGGGGAPAPSAFGGGGQPAPAPAFGQPTAPMAAPPAFGPFGGGGAPAPSVFRQPGGAFGGVMHELGQPTVPAAAPAPTFAPFGGVSAPAPTAAPAFGQPAQPSGFVFGGQPNQPQPNQPAGAELPYVAVRISGFSKPTGDDIARLGVFKIEDPALSATPIIVELFITGGEPPKDLHLTQFNNAIAGGEEFAAQKRKIHQDNGVAMSKSRTTGQSLVPGQTGVPTSLSNGVKNDGIPVNLIRGYKVEWNGKEAKFTNAPETQKPVSMRMLEPATGAFGAAVPATATFGQAPQPSSVFGSSPFANTLAPATFQTVAGNEFSQPANEFAQPSNEFTAPGNGFTAPPPTFGAAFGAAVHVEHREPGPMTIAPRAGPNANQQYPQGTTQWMVPSLDQITKGKGGNAVDESQLKVAYRVPGGPAPVAVGAGSYWYVLPGSNDVVKSDHAYVPNDAKLWKKMAGNASKQLAAVPIILRWMTDAYGQGFEQIQGANYISGANSSGRRKAPATAVNSFNPQQQAPWVNNGQQQGPPTMGGFFGQQQPQQSAFNQGQSNQLFGNAGQPPMGGGAFGNQAAPPFQNGPFGGQGQQPPFQGNQQYQQPPFGGQGQQPPFQGNQQYQQPPFQGNQQLPNAPAPSGPFGQQQPGPMGTQFPGAFNGAAPNAQAPPGNPFGGQSVPQGGPFGGQQPVINPLQGNAMPNVGPFANTQGGQQQQQQQVQPPNPFGPPPQQQQVQPPNPFGAPTQPQGNPFGNQQAPPTQAGPFGNQQAPPTQGGIL